MAAYSLTIGGVSLENWADVTQTSWTESGVEMPSRFDCTIESGVKGKSFASVPDFTGQELYLRDLANSRVLWGGFVVTHEMEHGAGPVVYHSVQAVSFDALLDRESIVRWRSTTTVAGRITKMSTDREMIQSIMGTYGYDLSASSSNVSSTASGMPKLVLASVTVRDALSKIAESASSKSDQAIRRFYVDFNKALHYFKANEGTTAPYKIGNAVYDGSTIIPDYIKYTKDVTDAAKKVYIKGANIAGTGWVNHGTLLGSRNYDNIDIIDVPESDTTAEKLALGVAYLNREGAPTRGGYFEITGYDGWRAQQTLNVRDSAFGLNENFQIVEIQANPNMGNGITTYTIYFGALPWRGTTMLTRKKRGTAATGGRTGNTGGGGTTTGGTGDTSGSDGSGIPAGDWV